MFSFAVSSVLKSLSFVAPVKLVHGSERREPETAEDSAGLRRSLRCSFVAEVQDESQ